MRIPGETQCNCEILIVASGYCKIPTNLCGSRISSLFNIYLLRIAWTMLDSGIFARDTRTLFFGSSWWRNFSCSIVGVGWSFSRTVIQFVSCFCDPKIPHSRCCRVKICISRTFVGVLRKYERLEIKLLAKSAAQCLIFGDLMHFLLFRQRIAFILLNETMPASFASVVFLTPKYLIDSVSAICSV